MLAAGLIAGAVAGLLQQCTQANKQKALYLRYTFDPPLESSPALDLSTGVEWNATRPLRAFGSKGVFAAQTVGIGGGPSGYFGTQVHGGTAVGTVIFSLWDHLRPHGETCAHPAAAPNATWCARRHAFPLTGNCRRHCLDCGLHPGWANTTGTQCVAPAAIADGDAFDLRLRQEAAAQLHSFEGRRYVGATWALTATRRGGAAEEVVVFRVFLEDTPGGVQRLGAFHEHIGCVPCAAFYESEVRAGPTVLAPVQRQVGQTQFVPRQAECRLYDVTIDSVARTAQFRTGPGANATGAG